MTPTHLSPRMRLVVILGGILPLLMASGLISISKALPMEGVGLLMVTGLTFLAGWLSGLWARRSIRIGSHGPADPAARLRELVKGYQAQVARQSGTLQLMRDRVSELEAESQQIALACNELARDSVRNSEECRESARQSSAAGDEVARVREQEGQQITSLSKLDRRCSEVDMILDYMEHLGHEMSLLSREAATTEGDTQPIEKMKLVAIEIGQLTELAGEASRDIHDRILEMQSVAGHSHDVAVETSSRIDEAIASFRHLEQGLSKVRQDNSRHSGAARRIEELTARQSVALHSISEYLGAFHREVGETGTTTHDLVAVADQIEQRGAQLV